MSAPGPLIGQQRHSGIDVARSPDPAQEPQLTDLGVFGSEIGVASLQVSDAAAPVDEGSIATGEATVVDVEGGVEVSIQIDAYLSLGVR